MHQPFAQSISWPTQPTDSTVKVKLVFLGVSAVGKTSVVHRIVKNQFPHNRKAPTAGQERFRSLAAAVVVYDITNASSFEKAKTWVTELWRQANPNIVTALLHSAKRHH